MALPTYNSPWLNLPGTTNTNPLYRATNPTATNSVYGQTPYSQIAKPAAKPTPAPFDAAAGVDWEKQYYADMAQANYVSAANTLRSAFQNYGLGGLSSVIDNMIKAKTPSAEMTILLKQTPEYKQRFPAMDVLAKRGRALTEGEYINLETSYDKVLSSAGLNGYFKSPNDYAQYISKDISVEEFGSRVNTATTFVNNSNTNAVEMFKNYYGINKSDLLRYYLDPEKATPELLKKAEIATVGGSAAANSLAVGEDLARSIVDAGASKNAGQVFNKVAQTKEELTKLAAIAGEGLSTTELVTGTAGMDAGAEKKITGLASQERARFTGKSAGTNVLGGNMSGSY